jgi:hypothetical protein
MKQMHVVKLLLVLGLLGALSPELLACRYNVRETGFVNLGIESYRLLLFADSAVPSEDVAQLETLARETLADSSVSVELISVDKTPDHPAIEYWQPSEAQGQPSAALVSPSGKSRWLGPLWEGEFSPEQVRELVLEVVSSPIRFRIIEESATAFGVVLLVEGENPAENDRVRTVLHQAMATVESELEYFPKPIKRGPVLITLTREELSTEELLLWSLHLGVEDLEQPTVVILYGRGRWIGPAMMGPEITLDLVSRILFIVGADCECGLSPRLIRGTGIPILWDRRLRSIVSQDLGFDPDNPLVRMEVSKILKVNTWMDSRLFQAEARTDQLDIPKVEDSPRSSSKRLVSNQFILLIGGGAALVLCVGALILIRARRADQWE